MSVSSRRRSDFASATASLPSDVVSLCLSLSLSALDPFPISDIGFLAALSLRPTQLRGPLLCLSVPLLLLARFLTEAALSSHEGILACVIKGLRLYFTCESRIGNRG